jgi:hypothetical protein
MGCGHGCGKLVFRQAWLQSIPLGAAHDKTFFLFIYLFVVCFA